MHIKKYILLIATACLTVVPQVWAETGDTDGGYWDVAGTWVENSVPGIGDNAIFRYGPGSTVTVRQDQACLNLLAGNAADSGDNGYLMVTAGKLSVTNMFILGRNANTTGTIIQTGGHIISSTDDIIYVGDKDRGIWTMSGGTTECDRVGNEALEVGYSGSGRGGYGTFNISGGLLTMSDGGFFIGHNAGTTGEVIQSGGIVDVDCATGLKLMHVGRGGVGSYNISGGLLQVRDQLHIPSSSGSGTFTQSGGTVKVGTNAYMGASGPGTLTVSGGSLTISNTFTVNAAAGAEFTVQGSTATVTIGNYLQFLNPCTNRFVMDAGGVNAISVGGQLQINENPTLVLDFTHFGFATNEIVIYNYASTRAGIFGSTNVIGPVKTYGIDYGDGSNDSITITNITPIYASMYMFK